MSMVAISQYWLLYFLYNVKILLNELMLIWSWLFLDTDALQVALR